MIRLGRRLLERKPCCGKRADIHAMVAVRDGSVVAQRTTGKLDEDYVKSSLPKNPKFSGVLNSIYGTFLTFSVIYALFRYAKRTFKKRYRHFGR